MESVIKLIADMSQAGEFGSLFFVLLFFVGVGFGVYLTITKASVWVKAIGLGGASTPAMSNIAMQENILAAINKANDKTEDQAKDDTKELELKLEKMSEYIAKLLHYNSNMHDNMDRVKSALEEFRQKNNTDHQLLYSLQRDIESITSDSKSQYIELNRQIQQMQRDVVQLHGTILLSGSDRTKLK